MPEKRINWNVKNFSQRVMFFQKTQVMGKNRGWITLVGFLLAGTGFLALILSLVGLNLAFLTWIDAPGPLFGFVIRLVMIIVGVVMIYMASTSLEGEEIE